MSTVGLIRSSLTRLAERITTPLLPADYLDVIDPMLSAAQLRGRVVAVRPETRDAATIVIKPGRGWRPHTAGQYLRIGVDIDGVRRWRAYSITSPAGNALVSITVRCVPGGVVSSHLVRDIKPGAMVHLEQAAGEFTLGPVPGKVLFVTAGSGITPVMGMLRSLGPSIGTDIVVVHSAPSAEEVIFGDELRGLAATGRIRLIEIHTRHTGRIDAAQVTGLVDAQERWTWACGPADFLDGIEKHWAANGLAEWLRVERFTAPAAVAGDGGTVTFSVSGTTADAEGSRSLLDTGEAAGVLMPSGCRMGVCFGCVVPLRSGTVRDMRDGSLTTAAEGDGVVIQTCISAAAGNCEIDL